MDSHLVAFPAYRESGVTWLGRVPEHWSVLPNRSIYQEIIERNRHDEEMLSVTIRSGVIPQTELLADSSKKDSSNIDRSGYKLVQPGDVVYNKMRAWQGAIGVSRYRGIVSPAYIVERFREKQVPEYFHYLYRIPAFATEAERWSYGITSDQWSLRAEDFKQIYSCVPPLDEQAAIVKYLAHVDRKIDRFIRSKRRMIELLNEQKQAIIHQAVTRGLDPSVPMKDSGVEWLGEIPAHWEVSRLKDVTQIERGRFSHRPRNDSALYGGPYPFVQTGDVSRAGKFVSEYSQTLNERGLSVSRLFRQGSLLMTIAANIGDVAVLGFDSCLPDSVVSISSRDVMTSEFLYYSLRDLKSELQLLAPVNTQGNLNIARLGGVWIAAPPLKEQAQIVSEIEERLLDVDRLRDHSIGEIDLIREYRTRLISDVVTGKIDVRAAAATLPEFEDVALPSGWEDDFEANGHEDAIELEEDE